MSQIKSPSSENIVTAGFHRKFDGLLETAITELKNYLEIKREKFGRFYFVSNDDLIEILSLTKDPKQV